MPPADVKSALENAVKLHRLGRVAEAAAGYLRVLQLSPDHVGALRLRAVCHFQQGRLTAGIPLLERALALKPDDAQSHIDLGTALRGLDRNGEALAHYERALSLQPQDVDARFLVATTLQLLGRPADALTHYQTALAARPDSAELNNNYGTALSALGRHREAEERFAAAVARRPDYVEAQANLAQARLALGRAAEAADQLRDAIAARPQDAELREILGDALMALHRHDEAAASFEAAIGAGRGDLRTDFKLAMALQALDRHDAAIGRYRHILASRPDYAEAHHNLGVSLAALDRNRDAVEHYRRAIALKPGAAEMHGNLAKALKGLARHDEAVAEYAKAMALAPDLDFLFGSWLHTKMMVCDWDGFDAAVAALSEGIAEDRKISNPFNVIATPLSGVQQRRCAEAYARSQFGHVARRPIEPRPNDGGRIRLGYFSADLHDHPVGYLIAETIERHDRASFEVYAFSFGPERPGPLRDRLKAAFDHFIDVRGATDEEIVRLARETGIDIAVDLMGETGGCRTALFAAGLAPVQVNYLGYPGTTGAGFMDYLIADPIVIPEAQRGLYSEKIAYLPDCFQPNDSRRPISRRSFTRADFGLPDTGFVFCCFNKNYKITPDLYDVWMRILRRVERSVLWVFEDTPAVARNLRRETERRGVDPARIVFAHKMESLADYLARAKTADLFLDTLYYNAHTTASDALWAGLPVLTCPGDSFASRVGASLVCALGLPMLVAESVADYEARAVALATEPARLAEIKRQLAANSRSYPLFDNPRHTRHLDAAYRAMWQRCRAGLPPEHLFVEP